MRAASRALILSALVLAGASGLPGLARAVPFDGNPKLLLHIKPRTTKNPCGTYGKLTDCTTAITSQAIAPGDRRFVYVLAAPGTLGSFNGVQFGINYDGGNPDGLGDGAGLDILGWNLCATLDYRDTLWPAPGTGNVVTWSSPPCQTGETSVVGYFYVAAYGDARLSLTPRPIDCAALFATCGNDEVALGPADLGVASFYTGAPVAGCNPCTGACSAPGTLPAPTGLVAPSLCSGVTLGWDAVAGADGYRVRRDGQVISGPTAVLTAGYQDASPPAGSHCYDVAALKCNVAGPYGAPLCVTPLAPVAVVTPPTSLQGSPGAAVTFAVVASGSNPQYQWRKDGAPLPGATAAQYTIAAVSSGDAGSYDVIVSNACNTVTSAPALLTVCAPPTLTAAPPALVSAGIGQPQVALAAAASGTTPHTYRWYLGAAPLADGGRYAGTQTPTLTISNITPADDAYYSVQVTNPCGTVASGFTHLTVSGCAFPPVITQQPVSRTAALGTSVSFSVGATGCLPPTYQWYYVSTYYALAIPGATNPTFTIPAVTALDRGNYYCVVTAGGRSKQSARAGLNLGNVWLTGPLKISADCTQATVTWSTNVAATGTLGYGGASPCLAPAATTAPTALASTGTRSFARTGPSVLYEYFRLGLTDASTISGQDYCNSVAFPALGYPSLRALAVSYPYYFQRVSPDDAVHLGVVVENQWCGAVTSDLVLQYLRLGNALPRTPSGPYDLPRTIAPGLPGQSSATAAPEFEFLRSEVGGVSGATVGYSGTMTYTYLGYTRWINFSGTITLP